MVKRKESKIREEMEESGYRFAGKNKHSTVKICEWTRKSLIGEGHCYKQKWYGIQSHRCLQCTTCLECLNKCVYCWRSFKRMKEKKKMKQSQWDRPEEVLKQLIQQQRLLLSGFGGNPETDGKKFEEAQNPKNFAISLVGESLLYPKLSDFMELIHRKGGSTFLVTKGTVPKGLDSLDTEPTNLYISLCAPDKKTFKKIDRPINSNAWKTQMESLERMSSFSSRKVIRMTLVKGWNMHGPEKYARLIEKAQPDFIEPKAYMHMGESQKRLPRKAMPLMEDVREFAEKIAEETGYHYRDDFGPSRVVLLTRKENYKLPEI